jgi:hypothetical protein
VRCEWHDLSTTINDTKKGLFCVFCIFGLEKCSPTVDDDAALHADVGSESAAQESGSGW